MSLIQPSRHPAYVFRTAGGLYLTTQQEWWKVTVFRRGFVSSKPLLMSHHEALSVETGISADGTKTRVRRPASPMRCALAGSRSASRPRTREIGRMAATSSPRMRVCSSPRSGQAARTYCSDFMALGM